MVFPLGGSPHHREVGRGDSQTASWLTSGGLGTHTAGRILEAEGPATQQGPALDVGSGGERNELVAFKHRRRRASTQTAPAGERQVKIRSSAPRSTRRPRVDSAGRVRRGRYASTTEKEKAAYGRKSSRFFVVRISPPLTRDRDALRFCDHPPPPHVTTMVRSRRYRVPRHSCSHTSLAPAQHLSVQLLYGAIT